MDKQLKKICKILKEEDDFLIAAHFNPDGDALGSTAALGYILKKLGKRFKLYNQSGLPDNMSWFSTPATILSDIPKSFDGWYLILDCGDAERMGEPLMEALDLEKSINIDHHIGNTEFATINWVDTNSAAVGEMIYLIAKEFDIPLTGKLGEALYLSLATDTGFFTYGNTRPETHEIVAELLKEGLVLDDFIPKVRNRWTPKKISLWSKALSRLEMYHDGQTALLFVSQEILEETQTDGSDCEGLVNFIRRIEGVRIAVLIREDNQLRFKLSLRSQGDDNVQAVALRFGGGGHKNASGGLMEGSIQTIRENLVAAIGEQLDH